MASAANVSAAYCRLPSSSSTITSMTLPTAPGLPSLPSISTTTSSSAVASTSTPSLCSSTVNLFREPHTRMKELVESRLRKVPAAQIPDIVEDAFLDSLYRAMWEFKTHEYIENHFIMDRLKARLQSRRIFNQLVCNCHEDSKLQDVIRLVENTYSAKTIAEKEENSKQLKEAIKQFLDEFLHHMEEEEAIFQPLLNENFEPRELIAMNEMVLKQHTLFREKVLSEKSLKAIKRKQKNEVFDEFEFSLEDLRFRKSYCQEVNDFFKANDRPSTSAPTTTPSITIDFGSCVQANINSLPDEVLSMIFSHLGPRDLLRAGQVQKSWTPLSFSPSLWSSMVPAQWARGCWSFVRGDPYLLENLLKGKELKSLYSSTESLESLSEMPEESQEYRRISRELRVYKGVIEMLLPRVGSGVTKLIATHSDVLSSQHVRRMLKHCPNLKILDLSYTYVDFKAFRGLFKAGGALRQVEELDLSGCKRIDDRALELLRHCYFRRKKTHLSKLRKLSLSGCKEVTPRGLKMLEVHQCSLVELDLSGCELLDGPSLSQLVNDCPKLVPDNLYYCDNIRDGGPYPLDSNSCANRGCDIRFCCDRFRY